jgi:intracellular septation protein
MTKATLSQGQKFLIDLFPLASFFLTNWFYRGSNHEKFLWATGVLMVATLISLVITYFLTGTVAKMLLVTALIVGVFGGLTLYFQDEFFLKIKVTIINALFALVLFGGLFFKQNFIKNIMGHAMELPDVAWRILTIRWGLFFIGMAILNEIIRRFTPEYWVSFKAFGLLGLTLVFAVANAPFMASHMKDEQEEDKKIPSAD